MPTAVGTRKEENQARWMFGEGGDKEKKITESLKERKHLSGAEGRGRRAGGTLAESLARRI